MSYRQHLHPPVSKAEIAVFQALSQHGLTGGMITQHTIPLKVTIPDFCWPEKRKAVYLDGDAVHLEGDEWDQEAQARLEQRGWKVLRIRYHAPLTQTRLSEVTAEIQSFLQEPQP